MLAGTVGVLAGHDTTGRVAHSPLSIWRSAAFMDALAWISFAYYNHTMKFTLCAIYALSGALGNEPFDLNKLPLFIAENVHIEDVTDRFREDAFELWRGRMGSDDWNVLKRVRYALVHRYDPTPHFDEKTQQYIRETELTQQSQNLVRLLDACLRVVRPMRQAASLIHGDIRSDGSFDVRGFDVPPPELIEVPEAHKLFALRNRDANELRTYAAEFVRGMQGQFWKFRMAVQFYERGYFLPQDWKARYLCWCSAIESIYTSHNREHRGSSVAKARIKWFLGNETKLDEPAHASDSFEATGDSNLAVGRVLDDLYELRNYIAHGNRIPDTFFDIARYDLAPVTKAEALTEAGSFIIRSSLLKILRDGLLEHFADAGPAEAYFGAQNLTRSALGSSRGGTSCNRSN